MPKSKAYQLRTLFLEEFTEELILHSKPRVKEIKEEPKKPADLPKPMTQPIETPPLIAIGEGKLIGGKGSGDEGYGLGEGGGSYLSKTHEIGDKTGGKGGGDGDALTPSILGAGGGGFGKTEEEAGIVKPITIPIEKGKKVGRVARPVRQKFGEGFGPTMSTMPILSHPGSAPEYIPSSSIEHLGDDINLKRLNPLANDKAVTVIECPGPGKFILVRKAGQINVTKITLSQQEVNETVEGFSERTRIPIIGGIFRATVGEFTIVAVISEFVGSRFIIYKSSPHDALDRQIQQVQRAQLQAQLQHKK